jgi:acetolactate synthase-1/2/3 large subunit
MSIGAPVTVNAGHLIARRLRASGVDTVFTLSGGHLFSIYDGCRAENIRLIDTRHEQTAAFAAEGWSKVTRVPGVAALTAGPGARSRTLRARIGNNGIWALEHHPMMMLYGYSVVAELRPGTRYDEVVTALGGYGEMVSTPAEVRPALERAFSAGLPAVVNALTDPVVAYPRRSNLG